MRGCYGSVMCRNENDAVCAACSEFQSCGEVVLERLQLFRKELNIESLVRRQHKTLSQTPQKRSLTDAQRKLIESDKFPVKARNLVKSLFECGITGEALRYGIATKRNPFKSSRWVVMRVAFDLLIEQGRLLKGDIIRALEALEETRGEFATLKAQEGVAIYALVMLNVIKPLSNFEFVVRK
jgi:hypothetical protein